MSPHLLDAVAASEGFDGLASAAVCARAANRKNLVSVDRTSIPESKRFIRHLSCAQAHPGLCATRDAPWYRDALKFAANLERTLSPDLAGHFFRFCVGELFTLLRCFLANARSASPPVEARLVTHLLAREPHPTCPTQPSIAILRGDS